MPIIPRFDERIGRGVDPGAAAPSIQPIVPPARSSPLEDVGDTVSRVSADVGAIVQAHEQRVAQDYVSSQMSELTESGMREFAAKREAAMKSRNVNGFTDNLLNRFDANLKERVSNAPNNLARRALQQRADSTRLNLLNQSISFESNTRIKIYEEGLRENLARYKQSLKYDTSAMDSILGQIDADYDNANSTLGLSNVDELKSNAKAEIIDSAVVNNIDSDPEQAQELLNQYKDDPSVKDSKAWDPQDLQEKIDTGREHMNQLVKEEMERQKRETAVYAAFRNGAPLDANSPYNQQAMNELYLRTKTQDPFFNFAPVVSYTNILPARMKSDLKSLVQNGSPAQKVYASQQIAFLAGESPYVAKSFTKEEKLFADSVSESVNAGVNPETAVSLATRDVMTKDDALVARRRKQLEKPNAYEELPELFFQDVSDRFLGAGLEGIAGEEMAITYNRLAQSYYMAGKVSPQKAQEQALKDMNATWTVSRQFGGVRYMRNAPELIFGNDRDDDWIGEQFRVELNDFLVKHRSPAGITKTEIGPTRLPTAIADTIGLSEFERQEFEGPFDDSDRPIQTDLSRFDEYIVEVSPYTAGGLPTYQILVPVNGEMKPVQNSRGELFLFQPEYNSSPAYNRFLKKFPGKTREERIKAYEEHFARLHDIEKRRMQGDPSLRLNIFGVL